MPKKINKKKTIVREHPMRVPISKKNPAGTTIRDRHTRRLKGTHLERAEIESIFRNYNRHGVVFPNKGKLPQKNSDKYDDLIAVWTDYFNKKFNADPPLDPDAVKALISSESDFRENPPGNPIATGIIQITSETLRVLQDPNGETKEFIFNDIRKKDLKDPAIAIPMGISGSFAKRDLLKESLVARLILRILF